jgi:predicted nucleic acid-binding protein
VRFWDASAVIPLVVNESETDYCLRALAEDREILVWCLTWVEATSALCRRLREGVLGEQDFRDAKTRLASILQGVYEVRAIDAVRKRACRLLEVHPLRAADASQIGAALVACRDEPEKLALMCFDERLKVAAVREGFLVNPGIHGLTPEATNMPPSARAPRVVEETNSSSACS